MFLENVLKDRLLWLKFKGFIRTLGKQDGLIEEFDAVIWNSLVQEVIVKARDDIVFKFNNGFEVMCLLLEYANKGTII